jgi:hypothetical protein
MRLVIGKNVGIEIFIVFAQKIHFTFLECRKEIFLCTATALHFDDWANPDSKKSRPLYMFNSPIDQEK